MSMRIMRKWHVAGIDDVQYERNIHPPECLRTMVDSELIDWSCFSTIEAVLEELGLAAPHAGEGGSQYITRIGQTRKDHKWDIVLLDRRMPIPWGLRSATEGFALFPLLHTQYHHSRQRETPIIHAYSANATTNLDTLEGLVSVVLQQLDVHASPSDDKSVVKGWFLNKARQVLAHASYSDLQVLLSALNENNWDFEFPVGIYEWKLEHLFPWHKSNNDPGGLRKELLRLQQGRCSIIDYTQLYGKLNRLCSEHQLFHPGSPIVSKEVLRLVKAFLERGKESSDHDIDCMSYEWREPDEDGNESAISVLVDRELITKLREDIDNILGDKHREWDSKAAEDAKAHWRIDVSNDAASGASKPEIPPGRPILLKDTIPGYIWVSKAVFDKMLKDVAEHTKGQITEWFGCGSATKQTAVIGFLQSQAITEGQCKRASAAKSNVRQTAEKYSRYGRLKFTFMKPMPPDSIHVWDVLSSSYQSAESLGYNNVSANALLWEFPVSEK